MSQNRSSTSLLIYEQCAYNMHHHLYSSFAPFPVRSCGAVHVVSFALALQVQKSRWMRICDYWIQLCLYLYTSKDLSIYLSTHQSINLSTYQSFHLSIYLSSIIHSSIYPSIFPSIHAFTPMYLVIPWGRDYLVRSGPSMHLQLVSEHLQKEMTINKKNALRCNEYRRRFPSPWNLFNAN